MAVITTSYYPRPEILADPGFQRGHVIIEASAGTGKTFTLEHLVLDLIVNNRANIEQILVVTFTDAATRELRERVRALIRKVCDAGETAQPEGGLEHYWAVDDVTRHRLQEALFRFDGAAISTIHGFCQRILSEQAFLGGRLFNQQHVDGQEAFGLALREEVRQALAENSPIGDALKLWVERTNSLDALQGFLYSCHREGCPERSPLTPAWDPPGFGEALRSIPPKEELHNSMQGYFTNKLLCGGHAKLIDSLFEAIALFGQADGSDRNTGEMRETVPLFMEWATKLTTINKVKATRFNHLQRAAAKEDAPEIIKILVARLEEIIQRAASENSFLVYELLPRLQKRLKARKLALGLLDYDDMLLGVQEALQGENAGALLDMLRQRWKYALVDEFQDTDPVQWEIFRRIFVDGKGEQHLYIIGDPKQAIYGFRGADVHTYDAAKKHLLEKCSARRLPLKKNYRSTGELIAAVNTILTIGSRDGGNAMDDSQNGGSQSKSSRRAGSQSKSSQIGGRQNSISPGDTGWTGGSQGRADRAGDASSDNEFFSGLNRYDEPVEWGGLSGSARENGKPAVPVHLIHLYNEGKALNAVSLRRGLANFIVREIFRLTEPKTGLIVGGQGGRPLQLNDIYILTRTGQEGRQIGAVLRRHGIHHAYYKLEGLFDTAEAEDVYRLLRAIEQPRDPAVRLTAWLTPFFEVPLQELPDWQGVGDQHPLMARLLHWRKLAGAGEWGLLFDRILTGSGLIRRLIFFDGERELTNYLHLFELLQAETHARPLTLPELARWLKALIDGRKTLDSREGDLQRLETDKDAVQILTMHKAKGLEAEVIFVAGGFSNPSAGTLQTRIYHRDNRRCLHVGKAFGEIEAAIARENREEDQRLAYVALTRARSRLYLPYFGASPEAETLVVRNPENRDPEDRSSVNQDPVNRKLESRDQQGSGSDRENIVDRHYGYKKLGEFYGALQKQLDLLRSRGLIREGRLFVLREASCAVRSRPQPAVEVSPGNWPDEHLFGPVPSSAVEAGRLRRGCRGVLLTSYTRMNSGKSWRPTVYEEEGQEDWRSEEVEAEVRDEAPAGTVLQTRSETFPESVPELPGGRETGIFLHALLEETVVQELAGRAFEQWSLLPQVQIQVAATARRHGFAEEYLPAALQMVYNAFKTPISVEDREHKSRLEMPGGIASGERRQAELSFVYPIPESFHPLLKDEGAARRSATTPATAAGNAATIAAAATASGTDQLPYKAWRGYIRGLIDLVFEHEKRIYLLDWKSDSLPSFDESSLQAHVAANYSLQVQVYLQAVVRLLGIKSAEEYASRFGGILYLFTRGIEPGSGAGENSRGVWFSRPGWSRVVAGEQDFVSRREWGDEVIAPDDMTGGQDREEKT